MIILSMAKDNNMNSNTLDILKKTVSKESGPAFYVRVENCLEKMIVSGKLPAGARLPSEMALSSELGINHQTIRKALVNLARKGYLDRRQKSGTFVCNMRKNMNIGLFYLQESTEDYMNEAGRYIQQECYRHDLDLKHFVYDENYFASGKFATDVLKMNLDGAIVAMEETDICREAVLELVRKKFPVVSYNNCFPLTAEIPQVRNDLALRTRRMLDYLWEAGHRKIGYIADFKNSESARAYHEFCQEKMINASQRFMSLEFNGPYAKWLQMPVDQIMRGFLSSNPDITAVVLRGIGIQVILKQLSLMGKKVPDDLSITSLGDNILCELAHPPITAARLDYPKLAECTVAKLLDLLQGSPLAEMITQVPEQLILRESVRRLLP